MRNFSPKIEIINHFDKLINRIDIDIEESLGKYNDKKILGDFNFRDYFNKHGICWDRCKFNIEFFETYDTPKQHHQSLGLWSKTTKVIDYLKQIRMNCIEELRKAQQDTLDFYKLNSARFKSELTNEKNIDEMKSQFFPEKFYFQVHSTIIKCCAFNIFTFVTDFYMSPSDIELLE